MRQGRLLWALHEYEHRPQEPVMRVWLLGAFLLLIMLMSFLDHAHAVNIPGQDNSQSLQAMGSLVKTTATIITDWLCRLIALLFAIGGGINVGSSNWKGAGLCFLAAAITAIPVAIVNGLFSWAGGQTLFGN